MNEDEIQCLLAEAMAQATRDKAKASDCGDPDAMKFPIMTAANVLSAARLLGRPDYPADKKVAVKARIIRIAKRKGFALPKAWRANKEAFVMSDQMKSDAIQASLDEEKDPDMDGDDDSGYPNYDRGIVRHTFPDNTFVFQMGWDGDWFKRSFTIDDNGDATLGADCTQVSPQLSFVKYNGADDEMQESMASQAIAALDNRDTAVPFDKAYLQKAVDHHETAIHLATKASTEAKDERVKTLAKKIVKDHSPHLAEMKNLHRVIVTDSDGDTDASPPGETGESMRESMTYADGTFREVLEGHAIRESTQDADGFHISGTAIMPGLNRSGNRVYPKETLSAAVPLFQGKKMYIDHPSAFDERNRPERSFRDAGAVIEEAWLNGSGGIDYRAAIIEPWLAEKLSLMKKVGALSSMGTSVHYGGVASQINYEGRMVDNIDSIDVLNSLDFVTEPGAWGDIARMESAVAKVARANERETTVDEATKKMIADLQASVEASTKAAESAQKEAADARKDARVATARAEIRTLLVESKLPEVTQARLKAHFDGVETSEGADKIIADEKTYIEKLTEGMVAKNTRPANQQARRTGVVVGLGSTGGNAADSGVQEARDERPPSAEEFDAAMEGFIPAGFAKMMG